MNVVSSLICGALIGLGGLTSCADWVDSQKIRVFAPIWESDPFLRTTMAQVKRDGSTILSYSSAHGRSQTRSAASTRLSRRRSPSPVSEFGDRYCLVGPLSYKTAPMEVEAEEPTDEHLAATLASMRSQGRKGALRSLADRRKSSGTPFRHRKRLQPP